MGRDRMAWRTGQIAVWALVVGVLLSALDGWAQPSVEWGTYLGGTGYDLAYGIAVDSGGNMYVTGHTRASGWVSGGWDTTVEDKDGYVVKLSATGTHIWSSYVGGTRYEEGHDIAIDGLGNVYVTGQTDSPGWVSGGWDTTYADNTDGYVVKLSSNGAHLWSTYVGGTNMEYGNGIVTDGGGGVCVTGVTSSSGWVSGGGDTTYGGGVDAYVVRLDKEDGAHLWSTYLGGADVERGNGIELDSSGNIYTVGNTESSGWVSGGWDTDYGGGLEPVGGDGFVAKLSNGGAHLWSTYLGGTYRDYGNGIAVDANGNVYAAGDTESPGWVSGGWNTDGDGLGVTDAYVVKLDTSGGHLWSTYLGGTRYDRARDIAVDANGNVYATGDTKSSGWVSGGWDSTFEGLNDGFVQKLDANGTPLWSSYVGGADTDIGCGLAVDSGGTVCVAGKSASSGWFSGGWDTTLEGPDDGFVLRVIVVYVPLPRGRASFYGFPFIYARLYTSART